MTDRRKIRAVPYSELPPLPPPKVRHPSMELWIYDKERLTLTAVAPYPYEIDLEDMTTSAQMLDWIFQILGKHWANDSLIAGLLHWMQVLLYPQANLCSFGKDRGPINVKETIRQEAVDG